MNYYTAKKFGAVNELNCRPRERRYLVMGAAATVTATTATTVASTAISTGMSTVVMFIGMSTVVMFIGMSTVVMFIGMSTVVLSTVRDDFRDCSLEHVNVDFVRDVYLGGDVVRDNFFNLVRDWDPVRTVDRDFVRNVHLMLSVDWDFDRVRDIDVHIFADGNGHCVHNFVGHCVRDFDGVGDRDGNAFNDLVVHDLLNHDLHRVWSRLRNRDHDLNGDDDLVGADFGTGDSVWHSDLLSHDDWLRYSLSNNHLVRNHDFDRIGYSDGVGHNDFHNHLNGNWDVDNLANCFNDGVRHGNADLNHDLDGNRHGKWHVDDDFHGDRAREWHVDDDFNGVGTGKLHGEGHRAHHWHVHWVGDGSHHFVCLGDDDLVRDGLRNAIGDLNGDLDGDWHADRDTEGLENLDGVWDANFISDRNFNRNGDTNGDGDRHRNLIVLDDLNGYRHIHGDSLGHNNLVRHRHSFDLLGNDYFGSRSHRSGDGADSAVAVESAKMAVPMNSSCAMDAGKTVANDAVKTVAMDATGAGKTVAMDATNTYAMTMDVGQGYDFMFEVVQVLTYDFIFEVVQVLIYEFILVVVPL